MRKVLRFYFLGDLNVSRERSGPSIKRGLSAPLESEPKNERSGKGKACLILFVSISGKDSWNILMRPGLFRGAISAFSWAGNIVSPLTPKLTRERSVFASVPIATVAFFPMPRVKRGD